MTGVLDLYNEEDDVEFKEKSHKEKYELGVSYL